MNENIQTAQSDDAGLQEQIGIMEQKTKKLSLIMKILFAALVIAAILVVVFQESDIIGILMVIAGVIFASCGAMVFIVSGETRKTAIFVKENITRLVLSEVFTVDEYKPVGSFDKKLIRSAEIVGGWNNFSGSDYVRGKYKGRGIEFCDIHLEYIHTEEDSNGNERTERETIFKGPWIVLQHDCELAEPLRVLEKDYLARTKKRMDVTKKITEIITMPKGVEVETESIDFNGQFRILCNDGHTAFYVLTPNFMEYLCAADAKAQGTILLRFDKSTVTIAIHNEHDFFESDVKGRRNIDALRRAWRVEIKYLTDILDELLRNDYLFKRNNCTGGLCHGKEA